MTTTYTTSFATLPAGGNHAVKTSRPRQQQGGFAACSRVLCLLLLLFTSMAWQAAAQGKIAFISERDGGNREVYVMNADGTNQTRLTNNPANDLRPSFSPDGTKIAFDSDRDGGNRGVYVMNADGTNQTRLTSNQANDLRPAFSPDGTKIAFISARDGNFEIYVMNADGTNQTRLTSNPAEDSDPAFSPDGTKIAFTSARDGGYEIYVMNADGTNPTNLTNTPAFDFRPVFSPDGTKIAFASARDGGYEIYVMNADGTNQTRLTNNTAESLYPAFSPDGTKIAFTSARDGGNYEIYVMNADGTNQTRLTNAVGADYYPSWGISVNSASVTALSPVRNAIAAPRATNVAVTLNKAWAAGPAGSQAVTVWSQQAGGKKTGTATVSGNTLTFNPGADFKPGETVLVTAAKASGLVKPEVYQFTAAAAVAPGTFSGGSEVGVGSRSYSAAAADVDGDGDLDILAANFSSATVSVRLNDGKGNFSNGSEVGVGSIPKSVAAADVDGDGDLDFLTANVGSTSVSVRLNDGKGNFSNGSEVGVGSIPNSVAAADVDGDGDLDFLTANEGSNDVSVRLNDGKGNFSNGSEVGVGSIPYSAAAADVDGDGDLDILAANSNSNSVSVRLNDGKGNFSNGSEVGVGKSPFQVAAADVDGDGDLDILTANFGEATVSVRLNDGKGNLGGGSEVSVGLLVYNVAAADVDGDGDLDILAANSNSNSVSVRLNDGKGNFSNGSEVGVGNIPRGVAAADVDGDGDLDILTANSGSARVSVRLNQPAQNPPAITTPPASMLACAGSGAIFSVTATNATGYQWQVNSGTGFTDLSNTAPYSGATTATLTISAVTPALNGYQYRVVVSGSGAPATSDAATLTVNQAPVPGAITGPTAPVLVNNSVSLSISFTSTIATTAQWNWDDDGTTSAGSLNGTSFTGQHIYTTPGVYSPSVILTNACGQSELVTYQYIVVYDPNGGFVTGAGWFISPARAYIANPDATGRAQFGFVSKYQKGASVPTGKTDFEFKTVDMEFSSTFYEWLVIAGAKAQYKGEGTINGSGRYGFLLTALDGQLNGGGGTDKFRIKIWDKNNRDAIVYDNNMGSSDDAQPGTTLGGGAIVIHSGGKKSERVTDQPEMAASTAATPLKSYPNPFSQKTTVAFSVKPNEAYTLEVYDVKGSLVKRLQAGKATTGKVVEATWAPEKSVLGVYIIRLVTPSSVQHLRVVQE